MKHIDVAAGVGRHRGDPAELEAVGHRVRLFAEANLHAILQQPALVRIPRVRHVALVRRLALRLIRSGLTERERAAAALRDNKCDTKTEHRDGRERAAFSWNISDQKATRDVPLGKSTQRISSRPARTQLPAVRSSGRLTCLSGTDDPAVERLGPAPGIADTRTVNSGHANGALNVSPPSSRSIRVSSFAAQ